MARPIRNGKILSAVFLALMIAGNNAYALLGSDACKDVTFQVNNNFGTDINVLRFELWSVEEGRWLNEDFANTVVPRGRQGFVVRRGENVEYGEGDRVTRIRVSFQSREADGDWSDTMTRTDSDIAYPVCVAGKTYSATINN